MSTRSGIKVINQTGQEVTSYSHHDGYREGMADKLQRALTQTSTESTSDFVAELIKASKGDLFTDYREHGDLEYEYEIFLEDMTIMVIETRSYCDHERQTCTESRMKFEPLPIEEFIESFGDSDGVQIIRVRDGRFPELYNVNMAILKANELADRATEFGESNPNKKIYLERIESFTVAIRN
jgi:hypothetical protein